MTNTYERCSCGARDMAKCNKESLSGGGKMCVKEMKQEHAKFDELAAQLEKDHPEEMAEAREWAKDFIERWKEDPSLVEITRLDADVAFEMLDNPKAPNDKLMELLEGK